MSDLLKEAIADAKAVRETALQNAKMALEEAFTPHLKSMLSAKLSEEDLEEDEMEMDAEEEDEEENHEEGYDSDRPDAAREDDDEEMDMDGNDEEAEEIDNPDQRITEDARDFTAQTIDLSLNIFDSLLVFSLNIFILSYTCR